MAKDEFFVKAEIKTRYDEYENPYHVIELVEPKTLRVNCPYCSTYVASIIDHYVKRDGWKFDLIGHCPSCNNSIFAQGEYLEDSDESKLLSVYPNLPNTSISSDIPEKFSKDYKEALMLKRVSPQASAALCRRILQNVIREEYNIQENRLVDEIKKFISQSQIPQTLVNSVDAIREVGNFAAHPAKDTNTGAIIEVEEYEADWLIDTIDMLFDFTFLRPAQEKRNKASVNKKLLANNKKPLT
jgi:Domain of unknown function (DUF4145)